MKYMMLLLMVMLSSAFAADDIQIPLNSGKAYLKDNAGQYFPSMVVYKTDGNGNILSLGGSSVADNIAIPNSSGNAYLTDAMGRIFPAMVVYTTDGSGNVIPVPAGGGGGGVSSVTASVPLASSGGSTPNLTCRTASGSQSGCLSSADFSTFNGKQPALGFTAENVANKSTDTAMGGGSPSDTLYASQKAVKAYIDSAVSTLNAAITAAITTAEDAVYAFMWPGEVWVSFNPASGDDTTGHGTPFKPWHTLQKACDTITANVNNPGVIHISADSGNNDPDTGPITCKPNLTITAEYLTQITSLTVTGEVGNDTFTLHNIINTGNFIWTRNDATAMSLYLENSGFFGTFDFEQSGAGRAGSFLAAYGAQTSFDGGVTIQAGEAILQDIGLIFGSFNYVDSGSAFFYLSGTDLYAAAISLNGGIAAAMFANFPEGGTTVVGTTTGSGTPSITADAASLPPKASVTGAYTLSLNAQAEYVKYNANPTSNWAGSPPATTAEAIDRMATLVKTLNLGVAIP